MSTENSYLYELHRMAPSEISTLAINRLAKLLSHATYNLVAKITGISRPTLYRWMDEDVELDNVSHRDAAWFIIMYETDPRISLILQRESSRPHLTHRILKEENQ